LSGSSAETFLRGFTLSGNTHSFDGFANTFPADDEVSFPWTMSVAADEDEELDGAGGGRAGGEVLPTGLVVMDLEEEEEEEVGTVLGRAIEERGRDWRRGMGVLEGGGGAATDMARMRKLRRG
jgi:hypothetical protein